MRSKTNEMIHWAGILIEEINEAQARLLSEGWFDSGHEFHEYINCLLLISSNDLPGIRLWFRHMGVDNWNPETHRINGTKVFVSRDMPAGRFRIESPTAMTRPRQVLAANYKIPSNGETAMRVSYRLPRQEPLVFRLGTTPPLVTRYDRVGRFVAIGLVCAALGLIVALVL